MTLIRPGEVNTQTFSDPNSISAEAYVKQVLRTYSFPDLGEQGML